MESSEQTYTFAARIQKSWILRCVDLPRDISKAIRSAAGDKPNHVPVRGWIEGLAMESTLSPAGGGRYRLHIHSRIWRKLRIDEGAVIEVALAIERERRETPVPPDLAAALADEPKALAAFHGQTPAFRRQIIIFLEKAKQTKTREKYVALIVKRMLERAKGKNKPRKKAAVAPAKKRRSSPSSR